ncbi:nuclear transport factor 2 family protein [Rhodococcus sp. BP-252]|uniref:nuclear transport factor 2 family protein n=1 Tax=unclassified Rhodococcus (in: high G+C Gram-positive bacteria) TaxID=192944 RepID=UPI001C9B7EE8|nr:MULTISPECIES: nuclear transport factor 2 family protein [unclassified Rhodococcus (in: high G+C Gram-positive bacteria)]MBY6412598.1 nuclear transport factor 2 family protein [Rhodococcus sp. BP-320]MBY6417147.1 nuclear transport factor 2 family protein [Rhodococcus sp. BP-321]MBY6423235.1 nuclear transport factor 2 family protein [Rhodococcus sp. BP-324]MBY6427171.1 nuclear transport factor 2 family protein [Rhodococcus sp. BP-323]MBY6432216.1 nuclear transport factor 2 family protein [Rho
MTDIDILLRLDRLESRSAIAELPVLYCLAMDERDVDGITAVFTEDATMRSADGVFDAHGRDAIVRTFQSRFDALGPTNHVAHGHVVRFDEDRNSAHGIAVGHAELVRNDVPMVTALRYRDRYRRVDGVWRIHDRLMSYMYYLPVSEYEEGLGDSRSMRAYGDLRRADWPETLRGADTSWLRRFRPGYEP